MTAETFAIWSNNLVYGAMAAYTVALFAHAAEVASGRRVPGAQHSPASSSSGVPEPMLVGAQAGSSSIGPGAGRSTAPSPGAPADRGEAARVERFGRIGVSVTVLGTLLLAAAVLFRGLAAGRPPWANMYEFSLTGSIVAVAVYLGLLRRYRLRFLAVWLVGAVLLTLGLAITVLYVPAGPVVPALRSYWLVIHVTAAIVATGVFTVAVVASALQLVADRAERAGRRDSGYARMLPSADRLDVLAYRVTAFGFPVWTFAVIAGSIWAEASWGRYWGWDPKEVWSLVIWLAYAAYLHARTTAGWRGRRASIVALGAYATLIFNYFGVNLLFSGLHSYGGV